MQLQCNPAKLPAMRNVGLSTRCSRCQEWVIAPLLTEFVEGSEIRHHWVCDGCGETTRTVIQLCKD